MHPGWGVVFCLTLSVSFLLLKYLDFSIPGSLRTMDSHRNSRRSSVIPKPETDLAEWTSKIKAMQRQVDADEEAEQRRLEEEIAAARQARLRRSRGGRTADSAELSRAVEQLNIPSSPKDSSSTDRPRDPAERHGHQSEALRKIMGQNSVYVPDPPPTGRTEGTSLASFIGGRATGPRLNKHAAQQDAHDPTQFSQPDTSAPHPIFGKGGVAMPGMISKKDLGGSGSGFTRPSQDNRKAISDLKAVASALSSGRRTPDDAAKSSYLRHPESQRRKSTSPSPRSIIGTEEAERYKPSNTPSPKSTLRGQKSFEKGTVRSPGTEEAERYRPSASPTPSTIRTQKSFDRNSKPEFGSEEAERYRPSSTVKPPLRAQKSFERKHSEPHTPPSSSVTRPIHTPQPIGRVGSPRTSVSGQPLYNAAKSTPDLRSQKSWGRLTEATPSPRKTEGRERSLSRPKTPLTDTRRPTTPTSKPSTYLSTSHGKAAPSSRERTISTPTEIFLPKGPVALQPAGKSVAAAPMLARPIQPEPRTPSHMPKISPSAVPSPAFQKAGPPKDVTPSISRLQGRGFVQSVVKASLDMETGSAPSSTTASPVEKPRPAKKGSVLDRWQPQNQSIASPTPVSPGKATFGTPIRRATTADPQLSAARSAPGTPSPAPSYLRATKSPAPPKTEESLSPRTKARMLEKMAPGGGSLGSSTTVFVQKPTAASVVDELGVKRPSDLPASTGKPLIHPTKDRAKKPRKASGNQSQRPSRKANSVLRMEASLEEPVMSVPQEKETISSLVASSRPNSKVARLAEQWMDAGPILPNAATPPPSTSDDAVKRRKSYAGIKQALPGLAQVSSRPTTPRRSDSWEPSYSANNMRESPTEYRPHPPQSPGVHVRVPSTGTRATVMEVAQALSEHAVAAESANKTTLNNVPTETEETVPDKQEVRSPSPRTHLSPGATEKRRSSYESFITLPPLKEEATPAPTPVSTLTRSDARSVGTGALQPGVLAMHAPEVNHANQGSDGLVNIVHDDPALPTVDLSVMLNPITSTASPVPLDAKTISVEVISIFGPNSTTLTKDENVFYESEVLAIVHRVKSVSSGLVDTYVWGWLGKHSQFGEVEEKKLHDLARRYGTTPVIIRQNAEPNHLIKLLGGQLAIRQGTRAYWSAENTAMHLVRAVNDVIVIDEHDLNIKNLCSAFSYCLSILGTVYVWRGVGSTDPERQAALQYAKSIARESEVVELTQGENDDNDMFWMVLGDEAFAEADYWKWRRAADYDIQPSAWRVDSSKRAHMLSHVEFWSDEANPAQSVYIINCIWELFVLVGSNARGKRQDIRLAFETAKRYAKAISAQRPYTPNVHVLVLPSQIPLDLKLHIRDLDEHNLNHGSIPDHMNLVSSVEASQQLTNTSWDREALRDHEMLPLGIDVSSATGVSKQ